MSEKYKEPNWDLAATDVGYAIVQHIKAKEAKNTYQKRFYKLAIATGVWFIASHSLSLPSLANSDELALAIIAINSTVTLLGGAAPMYYNGVKATHISDDIDELNEMIDAHGMKEEEKLVIEEGKNL